MPFGDIGGTASTLIITCLADCDISKGDPVTHIENYKVRNYLGDLFGQALHDAKRGQAVPVRVRGVCQFTKFKTYGRSNTHWRISDKDAVLVPMTMGSKLEVLYLSEGRMDVLL